MYSVYQSVCKGASLDRLSELTTFGIGGRALVLYPQSEDELIGAYLLAKERGDECYVLGGGSNTLAQSEDYNGVVISTRGLSRVEINGDTITAGSGVMLTKLSALAEKACLSGLEFGSGIPGSVGGACIMNAGAYGQSIGESILEVKVFEKDQVRWLKPELSYRKSNIEGVVLEARLRLRRASREEIRAITKGMREARLSSQPRGRSAGCIFLRADGVSAGYYIDKAGLKGARIGGARVSEIHAGFIINEDGATSSDVIALIRKVKKEVNARFKIELKTEIRFLGERNEAIR